MTDTANTDPYLWLEDVTGEAALDWVRAQNATVSKALESQPGFAALRDRLRAIYDSSDRIPGIVKRGTFLYNLWQDAEQPRGLWRRTTLESYRTPTPDWETVLDLDALGREEGENWVWKGAHTRHPDHDRALIELSRGGADAVVVREFDLRGKRFVEGGFFVPEAKTTIAWAGRDEVFVGTDFGPGSLTDSGYARLVKRWKRGQALEDAELVFEANTSDVWANGFEHLEPDGSRLEIVQRGITFFTNEFFIAVDGQAVRVDKPDDANALTWRGYLLLHLRSDWTVAGRSFKQGSLVSARLEAYLRGDRSLEVVYEPNERSSLESVAPTRSRLVLNVLENVQSRLLSARPDGTGWALEPVAIPANLNAQAQPYDELESDDFLLTTTGFLTPTTLNLHAGTLEALKQNPHFFDTAGLEVRQFEATSADGTRVPYFRIARQGLEHHGRRPTVLYGYGGFEVSELPAYLSVKGPAWLESGGVFVIANIRGGGEFGPRWHQAALREHRQRAFDDFIAVAEDLIAQGVTSPPHLGIQGGSNGGLLVGAVMTQRPELFGAVLCQVPLLDMRRYHTLLAGASWMAEYGDPDNEHDWAFIGRYSPYQNVHADRRYPKVLFTTSTRDDRVHPGHARKMAARMLEQGHEVLYFENIEGGHGGAADNAQRAHMTALGNAFFALELR